MAAFSYYAMCQGQQYSAQLGYSPMPINLVQASFDQIAKIPGADVQSINIANCNNPTFSPTGRESIGRDRPLSSCLRQTGSAPVHDRHGRGGGLDPGQPRRPGGVNSGWRGNSRGSFGWRRSRGSLGRGGRSRRFDLLFRGLQLDRGQLLDGQRAF